MAPSLWWLRTEMVTLIVKSSKSVFITIGVAGATRHSVLDTFWQRSTHPRPQNHYCDVARCRSRPCAALRLLRRLGSQHGNVPRLRSSSCTEISLPATRRGPVPKQSPSAANPSLPPGRTAKLPPAAGNPGFRAYYRHQAAASAELATLT